MNVLIAGASGNLGSQLTRHLIEGPHHLHLLVHRHSPPPDIAARPNVTLVTGNLADPESLAAACKNIDAIIYLAGVLFKPRPQSFLPKTNVEYVRNIVDAAIAAGAKKFLLVSFPHVEGETTPESPATERLDADPDSVHGQTRLEAEKYLLQACQGTAMTPLIFRSGVVYGAGVKLIDAAHALLKKRLLAIWMKPTWVHLIALPDLLRIFEIGLDRDGLIGIYNLADDEPLLLQSFLDQLALHWGLRKPIRLPSFLFILAAFVFETLATVFQTNTPLNQDILKMGMMSSVADTTRMKEEIVSSLIYPTFKDGIKTL